MALDTDARQVLSQALTSDYFGKNVYDTINSRSVITTDTDGTTVTFDLSASDTHTVTLAGSRTLALSNASVGQKFVIILVQGGSGSYTVTWFSTIKWPGGTVPTLTTTVGKADVFTFLCYSANNFYGFTAGQAL